MRAVVIDDPGPESKLRLADVAEPELLPDCVRIRVAATAVNRADLLQRAGQYPPPAGASPILGLECSGAIVEVGPGVDGWQVGERVMALLTGGGYAEQVVVHHGSLMRIPPRLTTVQAAAIPEAFLTVFLTVFGIGGLRRGGSLLVHGGGSGIGTAAIQLARASGATVLVTAASADKRERCLQLGADGAIDYRDRDLAGVVHALTDGRGVDVVLDPLGGPFVERNLQSLATDGRLVVIGMLGGRRAEIDLADLLARRLTVAGSTLRSRSAEDKAALIAEFQTRFGAALQGGEIGPVVDRSLPLAEVEEAHRVVAAREHFGKVVLVVDETVG